MRWSRVKNDSQGFGRHSWDKGDASYRRENGRGVVLTFESFCRHLCARHGDNGSFGHAFHLCVGQTGESTVWGSGGRSDTDTCMWVYREPLGLHCGGGGALEPLDGEQRKQGRGVEVET